MRSKLGSFSRCRPRALTVVVFFMTASTLALANAAYASLFFRSGGVCSYGPCSGWPLSWYRLVFTIGAAGWQIHAPRLAGNTVMWLVILTAPAAFSEWLLRRHRPHLCWSLRTMLVIVALAAACMGWFIRARNRAEEQDRLIAALYRVRMERFGPRWLDLLGVDRFRRRIVSAFLYADSEKAEPAVERLAHLPRFQQLFLKVDRVTPRMVGALLAMPELKILSIESDGDRISPECLTAIGKMTQLEHLHLASMKVVGEDLTLLSGLASLKSLRLAYIKAETTPLLKSMPKLPGLEIFDAFSSDIGDEDLRYLTALRHLRALGLAYNDVTDARLAELASAQSLEELTVEGDMVTGKGLSSLLAIKRLRRLHVGDSYSDDGPWATLSLGKGEEVEAPQSEIAGCRRALQLLRESKPRVEIDSSAFALHWPEERLTIPSNEDEMADRSHSSLTLPWLEASFWTTAPPAAAKDLAW